MAVSPEREEFTGQSTVYMKLQLTASENARHLLQEQVFDLESRLQKITAQIKLSKAESKMNAKALRKCMEEKAKMVGSCKRLAGLCHDLERECSSYNRDLQRYMETLEENQRENEELSAISLQEHQSEEAKLIAEIETMEKDKQRLLINLTKAQQEVASLSLQNRLLEDKHAHVLVTIKRSEQEGSPKKPKSGRDVGRPKGRQ